ncbi:MAG TPA: glycosyltransferase family 1 protein, partial [Bacillota bacterium]|nr:glycosyltransferase family 1 protein [Bacillota bacterium]
MKIAIEARPIKWSYGTGIGNYTYCLIRKLNEIDTVNDYTFLWPNHQPAPSIPFTRNYRYYSLPKDDEREESEIPHWLTTEKADVFHLPQNGFRTPKTKTSKVVVTVHDLIPYFLPEMVRSSFLKRFIQEMPLIVTRADRIVTVSEASKKDILKIFGVDPGKIVVIPSAPAETYFPSPKIETQRMLAQLYGIKTSFILYIGGLNPRKNVAELIYAYSKIHRELLGRQKLLIIGPEGKHRECLQRLTESLSLTDSVLFPGFIKSEDLPLFYNSADLFVYPSLYEGFGLPPIEAMACGTPVVCSNVSSLPEIVGDAALQVNPYDTLALAEAMIKVLSNSTLRQSLIQKGLKRSKLYNWDQIARQMLDLYQEVA